MKLIKCLQGKADARRRIGNVGGGRKGDGVERERKEVCFELLCKTTWVMTKVCITHMKLRCKNTY